MSDQSIRAQPIGVVPAGAWRVDPAAGRVAFIGKALGFMSVKGSFRAYSGVLEVGEQTTGRLTVEASSVDTGNARRDKHLRSGDFLDVERHPTLSFIVEGVANGPDSKLTVSGQLLVRDRAIPLQLPVKVVPRAADRLQLSTSIEIDRREAGMTWSPLGTIGRRATAEVELVLVA